MEKLSATAIVEATLATNKTLVCRILNLHKQKKIRSKKICRRLMRTSKVKIFFFAHLLADKYCCSFLPTSAAAFASAFFHDFFHVKFSLSQLIFLHPIIFQSFTNQVKFLFVYLPIVDYFTNILRQSQGATLG